MCEKKKNRERERLCNQTTEPPVITTTSSTPADPASLPAWILAKWQCQWPVMSVSFSVISLDCYGITTMPKGAQYTHTYTHSYTHTQYAHTQYAQQRQKCRSLSYHRRLRNSRVWVGVVPLKSSSGRAQPLYMYVCIMHKLWMNGRKFVGRFVDFVAF